MIFTYDKQTKRIALPPETAFKAHRLLERQDLESWVENYPDILGEELLILTTEYDKFDKTNERLDLLAIDKDGNLVVIELKRDDSGKNVDLQAIKYAAYCSNLKLNDIIELFQRHLMKTEGAISETIVRDRIVDFIENDEFEEFSGKPRIIIVSKTFRPEVTASVLWLRKFGLNITCIKLTPYELNDDVIAFESTILIPLPEAKDFIIESEKKENVEYTQTLSQQEYIDFYNELIDRLNIILPRPFAPPKPRSVYQIQTQLSGVHFEWWFRGRPRNSFGVELHFENRNKDLNKTWFKKIARMKPAIEQALGEQVVLEEDWSKNWSRLYIEKMEGRMTDELKDWAVQKMKILIETLQPEIEKLH